MVNAPPIPQAVCPQDQGLQQGAAPEEVPRGAALMPPVVIVGPSNIAPPPWRKCAQVAIEEGHKALNFAVVNIGHATYGQPSQPAHLSELLSHGAEGGRCCSIRGAEITSKEANVVDGTTLLSSQGDVMRHIQ
jgi:hypothetical protein